MPAAQEGQKLCTVCGQNLSGKPRVKDAQGRYACAGECQQKLAAAAPATPAPKPTSAPAVAPALQNDLMSQLINASPMMNAQNCAQCGAPMAAGSVVCVRCGHNTQTGKSLRTAVVKVKQSPLPTAAKGGRSGGGGGGGLGDSGGASLGVGLLLLAMGATPFLGPIPTFIAIAVMLVACWTGLIIGIVSAFKREETVWGVVGILSFVVPFVGLVFLLYLVRPSTNPWAKNLVGGSLIGLIVMNVLILTGTAGFGVPAV